MRRVKGLLREQQPFFVNGQQPDEKNLQANFC